MPDVMMVNGTLFVTLSRDRASIPRDLRLLNLLWKRRLYWTTVLQGYRDPVYLRKAVERLRVLNDCLDALGARSRPVRGLAVVGEVT